MNKVGDGLIRLKETKMFIGKFNHHYLVGICRSKIMKIQLFKK